MACGRIREHTSLLVLHYFRNDQDLLESCLLHFSKIRYYYFNKNRGPCLSAGVFALANVFASQLNSTLVTNACVTSLGLEIDRFLNIFPIVNALEGAQWALFDLWKGARKKGKMTVLQQQQSDLNFGYCDIPRIQSDRPWDFNAFTAPFTNRLWALLFISFLMVSLTLIKTNNGKTGKNLQKLTDSALLAFSALLSTPSVRTGKKLIILVFWMCSCQIIVVYYTGGITSRVIAPPKEITLSTITELAKNGYRLVFDSSNSKDFVNSTAYGYFRGDNGDLNENEGDREIREDMNALSQLMSGFVEVTENLVECISKMTSLKKVAVVQSWQFVISKLNLADEKLEKEGNLGNIHCYLGKRLVSSPELYYVVFSPKSGTRVPSDMLPQIVYETGIYSYWTVENLKMQYSKRVQDRGKFISPKKIKYSFEENEMTNPIDLAGRISSVFFVWILGVFGSAITLFLEISFISYFES